MLAAVALVWKFYFKILELLSQPRAHDSGTPPGYTLWQQQEMCTAGTLALFSPLDNPRHTHT